MDYKEEPSFIKRNNEAYAENLNSRVLRRKGYYSFRNGFLKQDYIQPRRKKVKNDQLRNPRVRKFSNPFRKLYWTIILATGLAVSIYHLYIFWSMYFRYPIVLNIGLKNNYSLIDPAVTLCNLNRHLKGKPKKPGHEGLGPGGPGGPGGPMIPSERKELASCSSMHLLRNSSLSKLSFLMKYTLATEEERFKAGHQSSVFIEDCSFNDVVCSEKNFTLLQSLRYGNCFTFSGLYKNAQRPSQELLLTLNLESDLYHPDTSTVGARVVFHSSNEMPDLERNGFNVMPGFETYLSVRPTVTYRLPSPYRDRCRDYSYSGAGSEDQCVRKCIQEINFSYCNCVDPSLITDTRKHCNLTDATDICCLDDVDFQMSLNGSSCDCPLPCVSIKFNVQKSLSIWPSFPKLHQTFIKRYLGIALPNKDAMERLQNLWMHEKVKSMRFHRESFVKIRISLPSSKYQLYEQLPRFEESQLFSVAGGELGIWLGLCISTAFGIVEVGLSLLFKGCKSWCWDA